MAPTRGRPWLMWSVPAFVFLIAFFHRAAPGVLAKDLMQAFGASGAIVGLLSATYFYAYAGLMIPAGLLIDAFGARAMVAAGGAVMGVGTLAMGVSPSQSVLFAGRFVVGLGATVTFIGTLKIAAAWFPPARFGTMSAVTAAVGIFGSLVATAPLAALVSLAGWRGTFWIIGLVTLAGAGLCLAIVRDQPEGEAPASSATGVGAGALRAVLSGAGEVLRNPHTWPPFVAFFFLYAAMGNQMLWTVPFLRDVYGLSTTDAAVYASATATALMVAAPLTGWVSDRVLGRRKLPYTALSVASLALWAVLAGTLGGLSLPALYALLFAMGAVGGAFVLTWPIGREVNPPHLAGSAVAITNLGGFLGAAFTQGPLGALLDSRWEGAMVAGARAYPLEAYRLAFWACGGFVLAAALATLLVVETRGRNVHRELAARRGHARAAAR